MGKYAGQKLGAKVGGQRQKRMGYTSRRPLTVRHTFMRHDSFKLTFAMLAASIAFMAGCSAPQPKVEPVTTASLPQLDVQIVARTLQTYQVGKTTIQDFIRDADLANATFPSRSYLDPGPPDFLVRCMFRPRAGSPWRIYETSVDQHSFGGGVVYRTRKYVVGDINKPICILAFDQDGKLTSDSPVP